MTWRLLHDHLRDGSAETHSNSYSVGQHNEKQSCFRLNIGVFPIRRNYGLGSGLGLAFRGIGIEPKHRSVNSPRYIYSCDN